jgi:UDP-glucose 4-epimerase
MANYLVTGAAGFIGSHICDELLKEEGAFVLGVDDLSNGCLKNLSQALLSNNFSFIKKDITEDNAFYDISFSEDTIIHLASNKIPRHGGRINTLFRNQKGAFEVLERARVNNSRVIFSSTSDIYGKNKSVPFNENSNSVLGTSKIARWSYAISKLYIEHQLFAYKEEYGIDFTILRFFGSYGPRHSRSWLGGPQSVFIDSALNGKQLEVHGDGSQIRSFCYIDDLVSGILLTVKNKNLSSEIVNLGNDEEVTIQDLANMTLELLGIQGDELIKFVPYEDFGHYEDVMRRVPDIALARQKLNFHPRVTLREGMQKTIEWHVCNPKI